jgi:hypothetical protein
VQEYSTFIALLFPGSTPDLLRMNGHHDADGSGAFMRRADASQEPPEYTAYRMLYSNLSFATILDSQNRSFERSEVFHNILHMQGSPMRCLPVLWSEYKLCSRLQSQ